MVPIALGLLAAVSLAPLIIQPVPESHLRFCICQNPLRESVDGLCAGLGVQAAEARTLHGRAQRVVPLTPGALSERSALQRAK